MSAVLDTSSPPAPPARREKSAYERLKRRHQRFVDQIVMGESGAAAVRSICKKSIGGTDPSLLAYRWLQRQDVRAAIDEQERQLAMDVGVRQYRVLRQMLAIATADPRKLIDPETKRARRLEDLDADTAAAIASVEVEDISTDGESGTRYKYRFWDKVKANDRLGQYVRLWDAKSTSINVDARSVTVNAAPGSEAAVRAIDAILARVAQLGAASGHPQADPNGSVLPAAVCNGQEGRGTSVADRQDSRGSEPT